MRDAINHEKCDHFLKNSVLMLNMFKGKEAHDRDAFKACLKNIFEVAENASEVSHIDFVRFDSHDHNGYEAKRNGVNGLKNKQIVALESFTLALIKFKEENCKNFDFEIKKVN